MSVRFYVKNNTLELMKGIHLDVEHVIESLKDADLSKNIIVKYTDLSEEFSTKLVNRALSRMFGKDTISKIKIEYIKS